MTSKKSAFPFRSPVLYPLSYGRKRVYNEVFMRVLADFPTFQLDISLTTLDSLGHEDNPATVKRDPL